MKVECSFKEMRDIALLVPHPRNPNKHPENQITLLAKIMKHQGWRHPIIVSGQSGFIVSGHGRLMAAKLNGWDQCPVDVQNFENEADEYAHMVADNKIAELADTDMSMVNTDVMDLGPDFDLDLLGIPGFQIELADILEPQCDEDEVPEPPKEPITKLGDIYKLGRHRLMCGDSTDILSVNKLTDGKQMDMVYTDPPYGINEETDRDFTSRTRLAKGNTFEKIIGDDSIDTAVSAYSVSDQISKIVCYWGGNYYAHKLPPSSCWIVWDKRVEENQRDMNSDCELAYVKHSKKESVRIFRHLWKGMIKGSEHGQARVHPTQKPVALAEWSFNELAPESKSIIDLFGGSGSTLIACENTNRSAHLMELSPAYCDVIVARWEKYTGQKAELISQGENPVNPTQTATHGRGNLASYSAPLGGV